MLLFRRLFLLVVVPWLLVAMSFATSAAGPSGAARRTRQAQALVTKAVAHLRAQNIEGRQAAITELEQATTLVPEDAEVQLLLARAYYASGYLRAARTRFERVVALAPADPLAHFGLGQVWRRDWLKFLERASLDRAIDEFAAAVTLDSTMIDGWLLLSSLRVEAHDTTGAAQAAERALAIAPSRAEAMLAVASTAWRMGELLRAQQAFASAIPRLPVSVRQRFEDIAPLASEADTALYNHLDGAARREFERRFWTESDPDLATEENEAQLEYWARVAQAFFLFYDVGRREWDQRGEVYVRYGPPEQLDYNPLDAELYHHVGDSRILYPMNVLVWSYPSLGMVVPMQDRVLSEYYLPPMTKDRDPDPRPDPDSLAKLPLVGTRQMRGVFHTLPPRTLPVKFKAEVAVFEGIKGGHVFSSLEAEATPGDTLRAQWVVLDSTETEVARGSRPLSPSACAADRYRVADFASDLAPGRYHVSMSLRAGNRRGAARVMIDVPKPTESLALSDLVVTCGTPIVLGPSVRLNPNPRARVLAGAPLTAYFEIYRLTPGDDGQSRFEYVYTVKSGTPDQRVWLQRALSSRAPATALEVSRVETNFGELRRQFVTVPVQSLPPGLYRLEIVVRDLVSGQEARTRADFVRAAAGEP